jgi:hypothetical protein
MESETFKPGLTTEYSYVQHGRLSLLSSGVLFPHPAGINHSLTWPQSGGSDENPRPLRQPHFYVPAVLRIPSLLLVFAITVTLIGLTEYATKKLPVSVKQRHAVEAPKVVISSVLERRQTTITSTVATAPGAFAATETTSTNTNPGGGTSATNPGAFANTISTVSTPAGTIVGTTTAAGFADTASTSTYVTIAPGSPPPNTYASTQSTGFASTQLTVFTSQLTTSVPTTVLTTNSLGQTTATVIYVPTTTAVTSIGTIGSFGSNGSNGNNTGGTGVTVLRFPMYKVFIGNYLCLVLAVLFKSFWTAIYAKAKLIEPFTQLSRPQGALASNTLHTFYLSSNLTTEPIVAFFKGHWFILWTSLVYIVVTVLAPLSSELLYVDTNYGCANANPDATVVNKCFPRLAIDPVVARAVQGLLAYVAIMTLTIMVMMYRMRTGIYSDPSSIANVAALVHHPQVLNDFRGFSDDASIDDIRKYLGEKYYKLDQYQRHDGVWRYGLVPLSTPRRLPPSESGVRSPKRKWKFLDIIADSVFLFVLLGLLALIAAYFKDGSDDSFNRFFNSASFGARFIMTGTASIISLCWKRLERGELIHNVERDANADIGIIDAHTMSPYHKMAQWPADPKSTILMRKSSLPISSIIPMLWRGHIIAGSIALVAVLADVLVIMIGSVPYSPGEVYYELLAASYTSMTVLGIMVIALVALMIWKRRAPDLPRRPDTVAAIVSYVSDSRMLDDFEGLEYLNDFEVADKVAALGKRYVYGKKPGSDGQYRSMVDEEPNIVY